MKTKKQIKIGGLKPLPKDERDFRLGVLFPKPIMSASRWKSKTSWIPICVRLSR
jgi:hypothetical protein